MKDFRLQRTTEKNGAADFEARRKYQPEQVGRKDQSLKV
jgi:hypothetical protein